jgi:hypothetical protein
MKPENTNLLQPTKYAVVFPEITDAIFFCQEANIPGISLGNATQVTPNLDLYVSGTKMTYSPFSMTFLVNEDLSAWFTIYNWMKELSSTDSIYNSRVKKDAVLTVYSNLNNAKVRIKYSNIFPLVLSDLQFDTKLSANEHITATATFRYDFFEIEYVN